MQLFAHGKFLPVKVVNYKRAGILPEPAAECQHLLCLITMATTGFFLLNVDLPQQGYFVALHWKCWLSKPGLQRRLNVAHLPNPRSCSMVAGDFLSLQPFLAFLVTSLFFLHFFAFAALLKPELRQAFLAVTKIISAFTKPFLCPARLCLQQLSVRKTQRSLNENS
ncbi:hypothetical protein [Rheinheimera sp. 4Y26]|uniref:hypothetical protein n=1 Tax=Rheinheimera sp. 4Y26 TaxID=2977811 RepID=UPI0021B0DE1A|nr:hypothetical protein [Rheinheimera sp. 4Y26]MCT6700245.1 hypothetical protein [Rheinheimera sp. 4Y26]